LKGQNASEEEIMSQNEISKSKQKRLDMENARKTQKKKRAMATMWAILIPLVIVASIIVLVIVYQNSKIDFSRGLTKEGTIAGIDINDYIQVDYQSISFNKADLLPTEDQLTSDIVSVCESYATISDNSALVSKVGDKVNIYYTATVSGASLNAITESDGGADFIIGQASWTPEFDTVLTGHSAGDQFSTTVTFPADFVDPKLAGLTVDYDITFHGIYVVPEFNDSFVQTYYSDVASTADGYKDYLTQSYYDSNLERAIKTSLSSNSVISQYPQAYLDNAVKLYDYQNEQQMNSFNQQYGITIYNNTYEMYGYPTEAEYLTFCTETAKHDVEYFLAIQYIYETAGLTNTEEEVKAYFTAQGCDDASYQELITQYGYNYLAQAALRQGHQLS